MPQAYQSSREDLMIGYFKDNRVTTPVGNFATTRTGGSVAQPVVTADYLKTENAGKNTNRDVPELYAYDQGSNNSAKA